jgi:hypothetical protein
MALRRLHRRPLAIASVKADFRGYRDKALDEIAARGSYWSGILRGAAAGRAKDSDLAPQHSTSFR